MCLPKSLAYLVLADRSGEDNPKDSNCQPEPFYHESCFRPPLVINGQDQSSSVIPSDPTDFQENGYSIVHACMVIHQNRPIIYGGNAATATQILEVADCGLSSIGTLPFSLNSGLCGRTKSKVINSSVKKFEKHGF